MQPASAGGVPWAAVVGLSVDQLVAWGALYYSYGVLAVPIARDLGVPTSTVAAAFSVCLLASALVAKRVGRLMDSKGAQPVLLCGAVAGPLALAGMASAQRGPTLFLVFAALGVAQAVSLYEPTFRAVVEWLPEQAARSRALLVLTVVAGFASTVFLPLTALLLERFGWRSALLILATTAASVMLPVRLTLPRSAPRVVPCSLMPIGRSRLLSIGFALQAFAATGATICLVWHLVERGETLEVAAALAGLAGASQVPGRLLLSPLSNALASEVRVPSLVVVQGGALIGVAHASGASLVLAVIIFGAAAGVMTLERAAVALEWFGRENFGAASGQLASAALFARAGAPFATELLERGFGYTGVFSVLAACLLACGALLAVAIRGRPAT